MKKNVLVLTTTFPRWEKDSTPPFVYDLEKSLAKDFNISVLAPHYPGAKIKENLDNIEVYRFPYFFPLKLQRLCYEGGILANIKNSHLAKIQIPFLLLSELVFAYRLSRKKKFALIHAHWTIPSGVLALILKRLLNIPIIVTAHAGDVFTKNALFKILNTFLIKQADSITVNSLATKNALMRNLEKENLAIIPMGVDLKMFKKSTPKEKTELRKNLKLNGKKIILFVGRLEEKKGVSYLIKSLKIIKKGVENAHLLVIGSGTQEDKLKLLVKRLNLDKEVTFLGKIANEQLSQYYNLADVFVAPSIETKDGDTEGLGVVLLEAIASGTPVVASRVGGIPEIIIDNKTGLLVQQRNPDDISIAVIKILKNRPLVKKLKKNAIAHIKKGFSKEFVAQNFREIYLKTIKGKANPIKILVTATTFPIFTENDSTPPFVYRLSQILADKKGLEIIVSTPHKKEAKIFEVVDKIKIYRFKYGFNSLCDGAILPNLKRNKLLYFQVPFFLLASFLHLKKIVEKEKINIVHAHWIFPQAFLAVLYKKLFSKNDLKIICTVHGGDIYGLNFPFAKKILKFSMAGSDYCTANSRATGKMALKILEKQNLQIIPMGVNLKRFKLGKSGQKIKKRYNLSGPVLLFVGMLRKEKGIDYLIKSIPAVLQKHQKCRLLIAGDGSFRNECEELVNKLNLQDEIIFAGGVVNSELPKYYQSADITILPSAEYEGLGTVLLESLAMKTPVIGSRIGGIPDIIEDGKTGLLVKPKNSNQLSEAIIRLLDNHSLREKLASEGRARIIQRFSWQSIGNDFERIIKNT